MLGRYLSARESAGAADQKPRVRVKRRPDGSVFLTSPLKLPRVRRSLPHLFDESAALWPDRVFMRQRVSPGGPWREIRYGEAAAKSRALAQWLLDNGYRHGDALAILSGPSIEHALVMLAAQRCGIAVAPLSVAYSLIAKDHSRLAECVRKAGARLVFADDADRFAVALNALTPLGCRVLHARGDFAGGQSARLEEALQTKATAQVSAAMSRLTGQTIARIMYTSGSTGSPKATPQTQACLVTTVAQTEALGLLDFGGEGPQHLEAMPFSHIMAGNFNFNNMVRAGGTIWLDDGKPTPQLFAQTIENLREFSPHFFLTVPIGYSMLCDVLEVDEALRGRFFAKLHYMGFGGAVLPDSVRIRLDALSIAALGRTTPIYAFYGATEFLFGALMNWRSDRMDVIGLPLPKGDLKLAPVGERLELRIRGPTLMSRTGYLGDPEASAKLFDEEGYFRSGDAVKFLDPRDPSKGLVFDGRLAEEFKLSTGTWVSVGPLRADLVSACDPLVREAVICGLNQPMLGALIWINEAAAQAISGPLSAQELARDPRVRAAVAEKLMAYNAANLGSARRIARALIMPIPLSYDDGEVTDKGNANQRRVRELRAEAVERLFALQPEENRLDF
ncbi:MAG: AMP-binding protein [Hyphomonadaceae bacterium]